MLRSDTTCILRAALALDGALPSHGSTAGKRPFDIVQTIRLALRSTITEVADELLQQMGEDDALVALMMDIRAPNEVERDRWNFLRQIAGTRDAALQRPGRVLPFFAVRPERPSRSWPGRPSKLEKPCRSCGPRDERMEINIQEKRRERQDLDSLANPQSGVDALTGQFPRETTRIAGVEAND